MFDGTSELSHYCAHHILTSKNYVRLQVDLHGVNDDLDDASPENIGKLRQIAQAYLESADGVLLLDKIVNLLT